MDKRKLWLYVLENYPYYRNDISVRNSIIAMDKSTLITDDEYKYLITTFDNWHLTIIENTRDGLNLITDLCITSNNE